MHALYLNSFSFSFHFFSLSSPSSLSLSLSLSLSIKGWELLAKEKSDTVYRRFYKDTGLYQYKVIGRYHDISARDYLEVQVYYVVHVHVLHVYNMYVEAFTFIHVSVDSSQTVL